MNMKKNRVPVWVTPWTVFLATYTLHAFIPLGYESQPIVSLTFMPLLLFAFVDLYHLYRHFRNEYPYRVSE